MDRPDKASSNLCWLRTLPPDDPYSEWSIVHRPRTKIITEHNIVENELSATVMQINREREVTAREIDGNRVFRYFRGYVANRLDCNVSNYLESGTRFPKRVFATVWL